MVVPVVMVVMPVLVVVLVLVVLLELLDASLDLGLGDDTVRDEQGLLRRTTVACSPPMGSRISTAVALLSGAAPAGRKVSSAWVGTMVSGT